MAAHLVQDLLGLALDCRHGLKGRVTLLTR